MHRPIGSGRTRRVNLTLSESLVSQAKGYTNNLSGTVESLLAEYVARQRQDHLSRHQLADACAADWNAVGEAIGSIADEHSTI